MPASSTQLRNASCEGGHLQKPRSLTKLRDVLSEAQGAVLPLIALLDALRWVFIALALGGIGLPALVWMDDSRQGKE